VPVYVRAHSLLVTGDGVASLKWGSTNAYTEDAQGNPIYDWTIIDKIFDTYIQRGMKPLAQIGFMPEALSTHPTPYKHYWKPGDNYNDIYTGWAYPPKDYKKWGELIYQWVKHSVARYGKKEVESWYWEVWNEPNSAYWKGTQAEFFKLYDYSADAVKRALPTAKIGGTDITGGGMKFQDAFLKHCLFDTNYVTKKIGSPLDLILFHCPFCRGGHNVLCLVYWHGHRTRIIALEFDHARIGFNGHEHSTQWRLAGHVLKNFRCEVDLHVMSQIQKSLHADLFLATCVSCSAQ
jgi:xylan 1,4-beta-xylosidase